MLNLTKKTAAVLLIFLLCVALTQCALEQRIDFSECLRRMNRHYDTYALQYENAFFSEGEWFLFVDTFSESDILINGRENEEKLLISVCVSAVNSGDVGQAQVFVSLCEATVKAFTENADTKKILGDSHIYDDAVVFSENAYFAQNGRYKTSFFNAEMGSTFIIEIIR